MDDFRWTGREGEKIFSLLCSRKMVTCNKADEDDKGWDFIVNFPPPSVLHVPIDQRSAGATALVQIKATHVDARRWSISLKNALSLAKSPLPAFIVRVGLDDAGQCGFRAVHVWGDEITRILQAARRAHVEGDEATNRRTISFNFSVETERADLLGWMIEEIDAIGECRYAAAKQLLVDTLGFEEGHGIARFRFTAASPDTFADLQLGLLDSIDLDYFSLTPSRFGIEASRPEVKLDGGRLRMVPNGRAATLRVRLPDGRQELVSADMFSATLCGGRRVKTRIKAGFIELVIPWNGRFDVRSVEDRTERTALEHIGALALLHQSSRTAPLTVSLKMDRSYADLGQINMRKGGEPGWEQLFHITQALRKIIDLEGAEPIVTSIHSINDQFVPLSALDALVSNRTMRIEFTPEKEADGEIGAFLAYAVVRLDDVEIGAVASRPIVADLMIGTRRRIDLGPATVLRSCITNEPIRHMRDLYLDELDRLSDTVDVLAIGDLQRSINGGGVRNLLVDTPRRTPQRRLV